MIRAPGVHSLQSFLYERISEKKILNKKAIKTKIFSCHTTNSKPVKQEVSSTVILPPLVFPGLAFLINFKFLNPFYETRGLYHKTYYGHNLLISVIS